jgi:dicarboxylate transporter 10
VQGFLKGLGINVSRAVIVNACELATYDTFKGIFVKNLNMDQDKLFTHFLASTGAGFVAAVCSSPVDVIKTRFLYYTL